MSNALYNTILPFNFNKENVVPGFLEVIALEVIVSKIIRRGLRMEDRSILSLAAIHAISQPMMGGMVAGISDETLKTLNDTTTYMEALTDGFKQVPPVYAAEYIVGVAQGGLGMPKPNIRSALLTAASKAITRPIAKFLLGYAPDTMVTYWKAADAVINIQKNASYFKKKA